MAKDAVEPVESDEQQRVDSTFRNGSITAIGVVVGFSLGFLSRWSALPGEWMQTDLVSVASITLGLALQVKALADLLLVSSLQLKRYNRSIRFFLAGLILVGLGVVFAVFADLLGFGGIVLQG
ncbi:hypothetical protein KHP60_02625 [Microvirga sp. 3-52]|jgi:uncharacterized membrane protein YczE|uniref:hypothetical protein n=1 Tax=Microvirga sp. 3-52 TaxID=2792425 RepID=UPI001AC77201|nr:hypothetical protein [Microvirga sp. 3-52]MBO1903820.1 hypothetical protein [Microvirga sp. 3-52]MBS7451240.1 hypothetical protein [Microvirga sp. 3-52]